ncbi:aspartate aminotransferase family protein [Undibacterium seohonense]|uniref:Aspartate aminotransferase family protein n=1 Tax=Undibacterium seohonense TaxID=1344950 RepID=A0ABR6X112_9BURK|nr:aminotransferase class V-fold PLP-dependent enzyme [Undibacterium seohonense]MBC3806582.1 aspartate aminotransferase family protein [Undibacterium seohonense]
MHRFDSSFVDTEGLTQALRLMTSRSTEVSDLPTNLPLVGLGEVEVLNLLAPQVLGHAAQLGAHTSMAHMDPPTPWITWAMAMWNASLNQNLLHEATSPFATQAEKQVFDWLVPYFDMQGGHFCSGSTIANLTGIWAARDVAGIRKVVTSQAAHLSVEKACRLLGLELVKVGLDTQGRLDVDQLPNLEKACLVLNAGTTATGAIDPLTLSGVAAWTHIDAAWAGPLRLSPKYSDRLSGIEKADSVAISAHKWLFQPKDSAMIMFRDLSTANQAISFGGGYLAKPNVGVQGSRSAAAIPLLATLLAWGQNGLAQRLEFLMQAADTLAQNIEQTDHLELWNPPQTAVNVFRPRHLSTSEFLAALPAGMLSSCVLDGQMWCRSVAANPLVDVDLVTAQIIAASQKRT